MRKRERGSSLTTELRESLRKKVVQNLDAVRLIGEDLEIRADLTNKMYTNVDPVLHHAVDQIPAGDWL